MVMGSSTGSLKTSLEVFPDTPAPCTYPVYTLKRLFDILAHMPYCDLVRGRVLKKNTPKWTLKKNVAIYLKTHLNPTSVCGQTDRKAPSARLCVHPGSLTPYESHENEKNIFDEKLFFRSKISDFDQNFKHYFGHIFMDLGQ